MVSILHETSIIDTVETHKSLQKTSKNRNDLKIFVLVISFLENHQKSRKKRNDLKFRNDLWVSTVYITLKNITLNGISRVIQ